jgi:hypothetical protein
MNERVALEAELQREPRSRVHRAALLDWLLENQEYDKRFAMKVVARFCMWARDLREVESARRALCDDSVFARLLKEVISEKVGRAYGDGLHVVVVPGYKLPTGVREPVGVFFLEASVWRVKVGARWVLREVREAIRFHSLLPLITDLEEIVEHVNQFGARGRPE